MLYNILITMISSAQQRVFSEVVCQCSLYQQRLHNPTNKETNGAYSTLITYWNLPFLSFFGMAV